MKWDQIKLGDAATFINGYPFKPTDWTENGREIIRIQNLTKSTDIKANRFDGKIAERYLVKKGNLLISWSGTLGVYEWDGEDAWLNQHIFKVVLDKKEINKKYFKYLIQSKISELERQVHGASSPATSAAPVPPHTSRRPCSTAAAAWAICDSLRWRRLPFSAVT